MIAVVGFLLECPVQAKRTGRSKVVLAKIAVGVVIGVVDAEVFVVVIVVLVEFLVQGPRTDAHN